MDNGQITSTICVAESSAEKSLSLCNAECGMMYDVLTDNIVNEVVFALSLAHKWRRLLVLRQ